MILLQVILCSLIGGVFSLLGGVILAYSKKERNFATYATAFAAGALLAAAFVDMIPEAIAHEGDNREIMMYAMGGLIFFFLLEWAVNWFHRQGRGSKNKKTSPVVHMIIVGDTIHNFMDGIAIAAGFLISPISGVIVTLAVAAHELPQEVGDFAILLEHGIKRKKALIINILSSLATTVSAVVFFIIGQGSDISLAPLAAAVGGFFIYIASSDIIPAIHLVKDRKEIFKKVICLVVGAVFVTFVTITLHDVIDGYSGHDLHNHGSSGVVCEEAEHHHDEADEHEHEHEEEDDHDHDHEDDDEHQDEAS